MTDWADQFDDYYEVVDTPPLNDILFGGELDMDQRAQDLFMEAMFEKDEQAYSDLIDYMWDVYGIDFEAAFDWEDFREWYG